jgi:mannose-6-phosphate isomerase-like protein (cupin superfamily)
MKRLCGFSALTGSCLLISALLPVASSVAVEKRDARITQIVHDVRVLPSKTSARPASVNETISQGTSFDESGRNLNLTSGAVLICVPPDAGSVRVITPAVTAAISGGIAMAETHKDSWIKIIIVEGQGVVTLKKSGKSATLHSGQMIVLPPGAKDFGKIQNINLKKLTDKSLLIKFAKLPQWVWTLIDTQIDRQASAPPSGGYVDPTGFDAIDQRAATLPTPSMKPTPGRSPPGSLTNASGR